MDSQKLLENFGFTPRESLVYLTCLQLGSSPLSRIARVANEKRSTVQSILLVLKQRWYVIENKKSTMAFYIAIDPKVLYRIEEEKIKQLHEALPQLSALMNLNQNKPIIRFYEGEREIREQYLDLLTATSECMYSFISLKNVTPAFTELILEYIMPKRVGKWIPIKVIMQWDTEDAAYINKNDANFLKEVKIINDELFSLECQLHLYWPNKISIMFATDDSLSGLIIESEKLFHTLRSFFLMLWKVK